MRRPVKAKAGDEEGSGRLPTRMRAPPPSDARRPPESRQAGHAHHSGQPPGVVAWRRTVQNRFMIETTHRGRPWIVIVEPDPDERLLVIVTVYESRR